jgi:hypothetical protein
MPGFYPDALAAFTALTDGVDYPEAAQVNELQDEILAIETEIGLNAGRRAVGAYCVSATDSLAVADGVFYFPPIPSFLDGMVVIDVQVAVFVKSTSGLPTVQIARGRQAAPTSAYTFADVLTTKASIDANEYSSLTATTPPVINSGNADILTGDLFRVDVDITGTGTKGLFVTVILGRP